MRTRVSVILSQGLLEAVDGRAKQQGTTRFELIEAAVRAFIVRRPREEQDARDREIIDRNVDLLNREAGDVLACL